MGLKNFIERHRPGHPYIDVTEVDSNRASSAREMSHIVVAASAVTDPDNAPDVRLAGSFGAFERAVQDGVALAVERKRPE